MSWCWSLCFDTGLKETFMYEERLGDFSHSQLRSRLFSLWQSFTWLAEISKKMISGKKIWSNTIKKHPCCVDGAVANGIKIRFLYIYIYVPIRGIVSSVTSFFLIINAFPFSFVAYRYWRSVLWEVKWNPGFIFYTAGRGMLLIGSIVKLPTGKARWSVDIWGLQLSNNYVFLTPIECQKEYVASGSFGMCGLDCY